MDVQAPPPGTIGEVLGVDDRWNNAGRELQALWLESVDEGDMADWTDRTFTYQFSGGRFSLSLPVVKNAIVKFTVNGTYKYSDVNELKPFYGTFSPGLPGMDINLAFYIPDVSEETATIDGQELYERYLADFISSDKKRHKQGKKMIEMAANALCVDARRSLANYYNQKGKTKDAFKWYALAARLGDSASSGMYYFLKSELGLKD